MGPILPLLVAISFPRSRPAAASDIFSSMQRIGSADVRLVTAGPRNGRSVLLLHGGRYTSKNWVDSGLIAELAKCGCRVVALDWPGFGDSPKQDTPPAELLAALLNSLDMRPPIVVAPSMSGRFAFDFIAADPPLVAGLILVAPAEWQAHQERLKTLRLPTLVVWGEKDEVFPVTQAAELVALIPAAQRVIIPGARHACWRDAPAEFNAHVVRFLNGIDAPTSRPAATRP